MSFKIVFHVRVLEVQLLVLLVYQIFILVEGFVIYVNKVNTLMAFNAIIVQTDVKNVIPNQFV